MKLKMTIPVTFSLVFSDKDCARLTECQKVTRKNSQLITIDIPDSIIGVAKNLKQSKTLALYLNFEQVYIDKENLK